MSRPNFEVYALMQACLISTRSPDPRTKVGAVCLSEDNRILSTGYNGTKPGMLDIIEDGIFNRKGNGPTGTIHAETNALSYVTRGSVHTIAVTHSPCAGCSRNIIAHGIKRVIFIKEYEREQEYKDLFAIYDIEFEIYPLKDIQKSIREHFLELDILKAE